MARTSQPLFGLGFTSKSPNVTANRLVNAYYEFIEAPDSTQVVLYGTAGLTKFVDFGNLPWRGVIADVSGNYFYGVRGNGFYRIDQTGNSTQQGELTSYHGRVDIATDGTRYLVVDGVSGYGFDSSSPSTSLFPITDIGFPEKPNTCIWQGGRFLVDADATGRFYGADLYSLSFSDGLAFATAESNPDNVVRIANYQGSVVLFGGQSIEFWQNVGGQGFPYARMLGQDVEYGLAARWSLARVGGTYAFLAKNREGQTIVARFNGLTVERISNAEFDNEINSYSVTSNATALGYSYGGHSFYEINFPSINKTWIYDTTTQYWSELRSGGGRHRAEIGLDFKNSTLVTDYQNGKVYSLDTKNYTEDGAIMPMILRGKHIKQDDLWFRLSRLELHGEFGSGAADPGINPTAWLRLSKDYGHTFGTRLAAPMGKRGDFRTRLVWRNLGRARDIVAEVEITHSTKRAITMATLVTEPGLS